ncbi:hypothetical protein EMIT0P294_30660 [Pseudomonas sp. IT-P294]
MISSCLISEATARAQKPSSKCSAWGELLDDSVSEGFALRSPRWIWIQADESGGQYADANRADEIPSQVLISSNRKPCYLAV